MRAGTRAGKVVVGHQNGVPLFVEEPHRLARQHAARDGNRNEGRLCGNLGTRDHDLIDLAINDLGTQCCWEDTANAPASCPGSFLACEVRHKQRVRFCPSLGA